MDSQKFPNELGGDLGGKTFLEILNNLPKIVEFVDSLWLEEKTTGIFKQFYEYIKSMLRNPLVKSEHCSRARAFVKNLTENEVPSYMQKYCRKNKKVNVSRIH